MTVSVLVFYLVFYLVVLVTGPNGDRAINLGPFPSRAFCEADRAELRAKGGAVGPDTHVIATGCITRGARIA